MKSFAVFALAVLLAPAALAQHQTFAVNPDASEVKMTLKTTHELVNGTFHLQSGSVEFDRSTPRCRVRWSSSPAAARPAMAAATKR